MKLCLVPEITCMFKEYYLPAAAAETAAISLPISDRFITWNT